MGLVELLQFASILFFAIFGVFTFLKLLLISRRGASRLEAIAIRVEAIPIRFLLLLLARSY